MAEKVIKVEVTVTDEEKKWVGWLSKGETARDIAKRINLNENTFAYKLNGLRDRFGCKNSGELIAAFLRNKLID